MTSQIDPAALYGNRFITQEVPSKEFPADGMTGVDAMRLVAEDLAIEGDPARNLATFVTTWMEPEAQRLIAANLHRNFIDHAEYPRTAESEQRCIRMLADLFHAPGPTTGARTQGSSEAIMLGALSLKWKWRERQEAAGRPTDRPNLVFGGDVHVVWEKFCRYFEVEPRYLPMAEDRYVITPEQVVEAVDEDTIGVVGILGTTYTGELEPIAQICAALDKLESETGLDIPVHVDAASGGFVVPFLHPGLVWDFRLPRVVSINVSGHKYGLTYPGIGFVVWRNSDHLPEDLVFRVNYLGGDMPTFTLNFSRPGNQVVGQYYNFLRLGRAGYMQVMQTLSDTARWFSDQLRTSQHFDVISDGSAIPVVAFKLSGDFGYTEFDVSAGLRSYGWQVPAYTMPDGAQDVSVLRVVVREGFSADLARSLGEDLKAVLHSLDELKPQGHFTEAHFAH